MRLPLFALLFLAAPLSAADFPAPPVAKADEALAKEFSLAKAGAYLDAVGVNWTRDRDCITCHTNMPALTAAPLVKGTEGWKEVRKYLEADVAGWATGGKPKGDAYVVATAFALSFNDAQQTGKLHDSTRAALDRMWDVQRKGGDWNWLKCDWPPLEHDDYYGAVLAALAVGYAPGDYAATPKATHAQRFIDPPPVPGVAAATGQPGRFDEIRGSIPAPGNAPK